MCAEAKTNRVSLVSLDLNTIEQLLDKLWRQIVQCNLESSTASGGSLLRMGVDSQDCFAASHACGLTSL